MQKHPRPLQPVGRILADFSGLRPAERILLGACRNGEVATITATRPEAPSADNTVRAGFLRFLALGGDDDAPIHEHGVQLQGAWVEGALDLAGGKVTHSLRLAACCFDAPLVLKGAHIAGSIILSASRLPGLFADGMVCSGSVSLNEGFTATGEVRLLGAQIGGNLACSGARCDGKDNDALSADRAVIKGCVFLDEGFTATGKVRLLNAQITGNLACRGARFDGKNGDALSADGAVIKGSVFLDKGFTATGEVRLLGAQITGDLECSGARCDGKDGNALAADRAVIKGSVFLNKGFNATGKVRLVGAQIGDNLECSGARCDGKDNDALSADRAVIKGCVFLDEGFTATGKVRLLGAQIGGSLECSGARFDDKDGDALSADGMTVAGAFFFRDLQQPVHGVSLASANVGGLADDQQAWGNRLQLDGFVYGAFVGGAPTGAAFRLTWLQRDILAPFRPQPWRQLQKVLREMGHAESAREVAIALEEQLRKLDLIGQAPKEWWRPVATAHRLTWRLLHALFGILMGYGYRPLRLIAWMLTVWLSCGIFYWHAAVEGVFSPSNPLVFQHPAYVSCVPFQAGAAAAEEPKPASGQAAEKVRGGGNWYLFKELPEEYTGFSPLAYSLDVILPLVNLHQENDWAPMIPTPQPSWHQELLAVTLKHVTRWVLWAEILFGWVASLLLVAVVSGLTKRHEE